MTYKINSKNSCLALLVTALLPITQAVAQISPGISLSLREGVAPMAVNANGAIGTQGLFLGDFVNSVFSFDFDSTNVSSRNIDKRRRGFSASYVYETPGTYTIKMNVNDMLGQAGETTTTVTVRDPEIYFASPSGVTLCATTTARGDFTGCPTSLAANRIISDDIQGILNRLAPNVRILLDRRAVWTRNNIRLPVVRSGWAHIAGYPAPYTESSQKAQIVSNGGNWSKIIDATATSNLVIADLRLTGNYNGNAASPSLGGIYAENSTNNLYYRLLIEQTNDCALCTRPSARNLTFANSIISNISSYGMYVFADTLSVLSNSITDVAGIQHGIRINAGFNTVVYGNHIDRIAGKTSVTPRGDNFMTVIANNYLGQMAAINPQNEVEREHIVAALVDGNTFSPPAGTQSQRFGVAVIAGHVAIRNNIFNNIETAVSARNHPLVPAAYWLGIYNNSYYSNNQAAGNEHAFFRAENGVRSAFFLNNLFYSLSSTSHGPAVAFAAPSNEFQSYNNIYYAPNQAPSWTQFYINGTSYSLSRAQQSLGIEQNSRNTNPRVISTEFNNQNFLKLEVGSPAVDAALDIIVSRDRINTARPLDGDGNGVAVSDIGAFERN